jgi:hypothetical protein
MSLIKPLSSITRSADVDSDGNSLQSKEFIHRVATMSNDRGRVPEGTSDFKDPDGVTGYYGFGADGYHYEDGVQGKIWKERECIDDFTDLITDTERWEAIGSDLSEGGIDYVTDAPFGKRLHALYVGPSGVEFYDRKGAMVFTHPTSGTNAILSARVYTPGYGDPKGTGLDNCMLLGIQQEASDVDYIFVGFCNTSTYPFSIVHGHVSSGTPTVSASVALGASVTEVDVAINVDSSGSTYRGYYNGSTGKVVDYTDPAWSAVGAAVALPAGWPTNAVPRIHASFAATASVDDRHSLSDVRVEVGGGDWEGSMRASWWLEPNDVSNPGLYSGSQQDCPDTLLVKWERSVDGTCDLTLVDVDTPDDPIMWRRWVSAGGFANRDHVDESSFPWWGPGWMDAHEGHIVMTRETHRQFVDEDESKGEIWVFSLRWDKVLVYTVDGFGKYLTYFNRSTERSLRETGSWGGRRFGAENSWHPEEVYDNTHQRSSATFRGTYKHNSSETVVDAITYGVNIRKLDDGSVRVAYGRCVDIGRRGR